MDFTTCTTCQLLVGVTADGELNRHGSLLKGECK